MKITVRNGYVNSQISQKLAKNSTGREYLNQNFMFIFWLFCCKSATKCAEDMGGLFCYPIFILAGEIGRGNLSEVRSILSL